MKTYNQITKIKTDNEKDVSAKINKKKFNLYSKHHEGHILLALRLFDENKIFGIGPQGFKEYCRKVNYSPEVGDLLYTPTQYFNSNNFRTWHCWIVFLCFCQ